MTPIERVLDQLQGVKPSGPSGRQWVACCPAHPDKNQSLAVAVTPTGTVLLCCYANCKNDEVVSAIGLTMKDLYIVKEPEDPGVTVSRLAMYKRLPVSALLDNGVRDVLGSRTIQIPYFDENKQELFCRTRSGMKSSTIRQPDGISLQAYGIWKLAKFAEDGHKQLIIVEGESDCWALWHHGFAVLGLPGAQTARTLKLDYISKFESVLIWQEPQKAGQAFAHKVINQVRDVGYTGQILVYATPDDAKDPSAIAAFKGDTFPDYFRELIAGAKPAGDTTAEVSHPIVSSKVPEIVRRSGIEASPFGWGEFPCTEEGNAGRLDKLHGKNMMFVKEWRSWYVWNGNFWERDDIKVESLSAHAVHGIWMEAQIAPNEATQKKVETWWHESQSANRITASIRLAKSKRAHSMVDLNSKPNLFIAANGTIDLHTGEFCESRREDMQTIGSRCEYQADAKCPEWEKFIQTIFPETDGHEGVQSFIKRLLGYCCTGYTARENLLPIFWGATGANGKSTLIRILSAVLGDHYTGLAPRGLLMQRAGDQHPTELADLYGKRLVFSVETAEGKKLDSELIKYLTGGENVKARRMREDFWEFKPTHKFILCTNYEPRASANDSGLWRRILMIPFRVRFWKPEDDIKGDPALIQDPHVEDRIMANLPGVLNWLIQGSIEYLRDGLQPPECVMAATRKYRNSEDTLGMFIEDRAKVGPELMITKDIFHSEFERWCKNSGTRMMSKRALGIAMISKGFSEYRNERKRYWKGIGFPSSLSDLDDL